MNRYKVLVSGGRSFDAEAEDKGFFLYEKT